MTDSPIRGNIFIEDGNPPVADYTPARKINVTIGFDAASVDDLAGILNVAGTLASDKVAELLGRSPKTATVDTPAGETKAARKPRQPKEPAAGATPSPSTSTDPLADIGGPAEATPAPSGESPADPLGDLDDWEVVAEETKPVTDDELNAAVQKRNGELKDAVKIRGLIGGFNPDPTKSFQLRQIPAEKRARFLAELAALS